MGQEDIIGTLPGCDRRIINSNNAIVRLKSGGGGRRSGDNMAGNRRLLDVSRDTDPEHVRQGENKKGENEIGHRTGSDDQRTDTERLGGKGAPLVAGKRCDCLSLDSASLPEHEDIPAQRNGTDHILGLPPLP